MKIKNYIYVLLACYAATLLRVFIDNNFLISIVGSFCFGFLVSKNLNDSGKQILITGFLSCFTSFSGFIYFLYEIFNQGDWRKFLFFFNLIIFINLLTMFFGYWISRKMT